MKRIFEKLAFANVVAPQSVEASTEKTTGYVDASGTEEVAFLISAAALGKGRSLTVTLMGDAQTREACQEEGKGGDEG